MSKQFFAEKVLFFNGSISMLYSVVGLAPLSFMSMHKQYDVVQYQQRVNPELVTRFAQKYIETSASSNRSGVIMFTTISVQHKQVFNIFPII